MPTYQGAHTLRRHGIAVDDAIPQAPFIYVEVNTNSFTSAFLSFYGVNGSLVYTILYVAPSIGLPLKGFVGLAAELQFVTDTGEPHGVCGLIKAAASGQRDGGLATYQLVLRDGFYGVFIDKNEIEIAAIVLAGWRERGSLLAAAFDDTLAVELAQQQFPQRASTRQDNESDCVFLTRLFKRRGSPGSCDPGGRRRPLRWRR